MSHIADEFEFNMQNLESNLKRATYLCKAIGYDNIINKAQSNSGFIANMFGIPNYIYQCYLEGLFRNIEYYEIRYPNPTRKFNEDLLNPDKDDSTLTEIEVAAKLAPYFKITPEYIIDQSKPKESKNLDLLIEDENSGEKVLIEIATKRFDYEDEEVHVYYPGGKGGRGYKIKNGCYNKLEEQLSFIQSKKIDLKCPLILLFKDQSPFPFNYPLNHNEFLNGLYGQEYIQVMKKPDNETEYKLTRYNNGFYHENSIRFISYIGIYQLKFTDKYRLVGKFYKPKKNPQYEMSSEFKRKLENALFGCITDVDLS